MVIKCFYIKNTKHLVLNILSVISCAKDNDKIVSHYNNTLN
jgi:hypothetical protein